MHKVIVVLTISAMSSCSFNHKAEAMPPVHELYYELSAKEQQVYNYFSAEERANVNTNSNIWQLKTAIGDEFTN